MHESDTLSDKLARHLKDAIYRGDYLPGEAVPSERALANEHDLSRTTVRRALESLIETGILERRPGSGTFVTDFGGVQTTADTLGLIVPTLINPYYGEISNAIENYAREHGYQLLIGQSDYSFSIESSYLARYADEPSVKGVIIVPNIEDASVGAFRYLRQREKPFVFLGRWPNGVEADHISSAYRTGAEAVTSHLIQLGHEDIAYIEGRPHMPDSPLLQGYRDALRKHGLPEDRDRILLSDTPAEESGREGMRHLLASREQVTAVFARNDLTASGVMKELATTDLRVPDDISVVGFDSTQLAMHLRPALTTVDTTLREIGRQALLMLIDRVEQTYEGPPRQILIQPQLVIRESSVAPRAKRVMG